MRKLTIAALLTAAAFTPAIAVADDASSAVSNLLDSTSAAVSADAQVSANASVDANASSAAVTTDTSASANAAVNADTQFSYDQLINDINTPDVTATTTAIAAITSDANVTIVPVSTLEGSASADASALANAQTSGSDRLGKLRAAVNANAAIEAKLTAAGYSDADVLSVQTASSGAVWVYVQDKK